MGQAVEVPYVNATIKLDGADIGFYHLIQEVPYDEIHIGMRVEAGVEADARSGVQPPSPSHTSVR